MSHNQAIIEGLESQKKKAKVGDDFNHLVYWQGEVEESRGRMTEYINMWNAEVEEIHTDKQLRNLAAKLGMPWGALGGGNGFDNAADNARLLELSKGRKKAAKNVERNQRMVDALTDQTQYDQVYDFDTREFNEGDVKFTPFAARF